MFKKLLVPVDRSPLAEQALGQAAAIARASHAAIDVILVHQPLTLGGFEDAPWNAREWDDERKYVEAIADELKSGAGTPTTHEMMRGDPVEMICSRAKDIGADLVVMTSHGRTGLSRAWIGSVADGVMRHSSIPVLMLRPSHGKTRADAAKHLFKHILVPLDGSGFASDALPSALALAEACNARITLLRVVSPVPLITPDIGVPFGYLPIAQDDVLTERVFSEAKEQVTEAAQRVSEQRKVQVDAQVVLAGSTAQGILDEARRHNVDAIVMSTHGRGASRLFIGSVADKIVRASGLPVLLHRPVGVAAAPLLTPETVAEQLPALANV